MPARAAPRDQHLLGGLRAGLVTGATDDDLQAVDNHSLAAPSSVTASCGPLLAGAAAHPRAGSLRPDRPGHRPGPDTNNRRTLSASTPSASWYFPRCFNGIAALPLIWIIIRIASDRRAMGAVGGLGRAGVLPGTAPDSRWPARGSAVFTAPPSPRSTTAPRTLGGPPGDRPAPHVRPAGPADPVHIHTPHRRCPGQSSPRTRGTALRATPGGGKPRLRGDEQARDGVGHADEGGHDDGPERQPAAQSACVWLPRRRGRDPARRTAAPPEPPPTRTSSSASRMRS